MGYTHFWTIGKPLTPVQFQKFSARVKLLANDLPPHSRSSGAYHVSVPLKIRGPNGYGRGRFTDKIVAFNGDGTVIVDGMPGYYNVEPFIIKLGDMGDYYCKTERMPYDVLVQAALLVLKEVAGQKVKITSDGNKKDWECAKAFYKRVFKKDPPMIL